MSAGTEFPRERALKYQTRRRRARFVYYYPASVLVALAGIAVVWEFGILLATLLLVVAVALWRLGEISYRCPSCGRNPIDVERDAFSPKSCVCCGATLKWKD
jgi:hypothetical protein